jgi:hypothetical protein
MLVVVLWLMLLVAWGVVAATAAGVTLRCECRLS